MSLLDSIDKSTYSLLLPENTEMNHYASPGDESSDERRDTQVGLSIQHQSYTALSNNGNNGINHKSSSSLNQPLHQHTIINMKTTLVNGSCSSSSNCDKLDSMSDLDYQHDSGFDVKHGTSTSNVDKETFDCNQLQYYQQPNSSNLMGSQGIIEAKQTHSTSSFNIECSQSGITGNGFSNVGSTIASSNGSIQTNIKTEGSGAILYWAPPDTYINSNNLVSTSGSSCNAYSGGTKALPNNYFVSEYADIFGNMANYNETEDVAKLPITTEESKMYLIGLSQSHDSGRGGAESYILDDETVDNEDNSPFQSATEEMTADGEHDQDPLLFRAPAKQNVFHQFIRSAKYSAKSRITTMQGRRNSFQNNRYPACSSRDDSSSSALIKEVNRQETNEGDGRDLSSIISGSSEDLRGGSTSHCSIGILLAVISCFFFATSALIVKISNLHPMELLAVRGTIQAILVSPIVISTGNSFFGPRGCRSLLLARAILGSVALVMGFASLHLLPLADAATVIFTSPVFVSIFACLCLREVCSWFDVSMIALTLVGVLLVSKPSFSFINTGTWTGIVGTVCGLIAAMLTALAFIVLRQLKQVHYSVTVFWFSTVLLCFGAILTVALDGFTLPRTWPNILECVGIGFCGFMGQILLTKALQSENALPIAVTRTFDIVLAFFYQITLLHDTPDMYSYLGSVLVVSCVLLTAFHRWYKESTKKKYARVLKIPDEYEQHIDESHDGPISSSSSSYNKHNHHPHHPGKHMDGNYGEEEEEERLS